MVTSQISDVIEHLRRVLQDGAGRTDEQLLSDYVNRRDARAIAALVRRHGPMVWGVCRRILAGHHDAEDAFQATFLVLGRRAASIASRELLANWLSGVAHQTARKAKATAARRKERERQVTDMPEPATPRLDSWSDLQPVLDEELSRLSDKHRGVIVLCDLQGRTRREAARQLGCAEGTVASRLARARKLLAKRLRQRGLDLTCGVLAAALAQQAAAAVPNSAVVATIKAAGAFAAGNTAVGISAQVAALTEGVMKAMLFTKLRSAVAVVLMLGLLASGATILACRTSAGHDNNKPAAEQPMELAAKQQKEKGGFTAWGKEVGGLQAGLAFRPGDHRTYHHGETAKLVVRVRNVGNETVKFKYLDAFPLPTVTNGDGKALQKLGLSTGPRASARSPEVLEANLAPGKEIELYELKLVLEKNDFEAVVSRGSQGVLWASGKVGIQYERLASPDSDAILGKLATGMLELEIKPAPPAEAKNAAQTTDLDRLQGTWRVTSGTFEAKDDMEEKHWTIEGGTVTVTVESKKTGTSKIYRRFRLHEKADPKEIDFVDGNAGNLSAPQAWDKLFDDADERREGIYSLSGDRLTMLVNGKKEGRSVTFMTIRPVLILERETPRGPKKEKADKPAQANPALEALGKQEQDALKGQQFGLRNPRAFQDSAIGPEDDLIGGLVGPWWHQELPLAAAQASVIKKLDDLLMDAGDDAGRAVADYLNTHPIGFEGTVDRYYERRRQSRLWGRKMVALGLLTEEQAAFVLYRFTSGNRPHHVLRYSHVQELLGITAAQIKELDEIGDAALKRELQLNLFSVDPPEQEYIAAVMAANQKRMDKESLNVLTPMQRKLWDAFTARRTLPAEPPAMPAPSEAEAARIKIEDLSPVFRAIREKRDALKLSDGQKKLLTRLEEITRLGLYWISLRKSAAAPATAAQAAQARAEFIQQAEYIALFAILTEKQAQEVKTPLSDRLADGQGSPGRGRPLDKVPVECYRSSRDSSGRIYPFRLFPPWSPSWHSLLS